MWRGDGRELYYLASDQKLMAVAISAKSAGVLAGTPQALFTTRTYTLTQNRNDYVPHPSGKRFLVTAAGSELPSEPIVIIQNWPAALPRNADVRR